MVASSTEVDFKREARKLLNEFSKDRFVAAWIDKCMHFGNTTSNRAEIAHARLKRQLGISQGTFATTWENIHALLELQHTEIKASFKKSLIVVPHDFRSSDFKELRGFVSISALYMSSYELWLTSHHYLLSGACLIMLSSHTFTVVVASTGDA
ncbi:hypothetical protein L3X38_012095 [Prunus dulcis]|uniref:Uncharacterized protein n=1 Tax=Prunus dulcis TaxID=3755 RepID=A0AAD4WJE1_PRUDU|nr:hypothetical protein L3X38_012095 [Prunus dulcis]